MFCRGLFLKAKFTLTPSCFFQGFSPRLEPASPLPFPPFPSPSLTLSFPPSLLFFHNGGPAYRRANCRVQGGVRALRQGWRRYVACSLPFFWWEKLALYLSVDVALKGCGAGVCFPRVRVFWLVAFVSFCGENTYICSLAEASFRIGGSVLYVCTCASLRSGGGCLLFQTTQGASKQYNRVKKKGN